MVVSMKTIFWIRHRIISVWVRALVNKLLSPCSWDKTARCDVMQHSNIYKIKFFRIFSLLLQTRENFVQRILWRWVGYRSLYSDWLQAGRSGNRIPVGARFSAPVHTGPGDVLASCKMGTGSFPGVKSGRGVTLTPHPFLVPRSRKTSVPEQGCTLPYLYSLKRRK